MVSVGRSKLESAVVELQVAHRELSRLRLETLDLYGKLDAIEHRLDAKAVTDPELIAVKTEIQIREQAYQELEHRVRGLQATIRAERERM